MRLIDLTHSTTQRTLDKTSVPVVVRSVDSIDRVPLDRLIGLATVVDVVDRPDASRVTRADVATTGLSGIQGCILKSSWCDRHLQRGGEEAPRLDVEAAGYLLENGVRVVAADFPLANEAADMLLQNSCVLTYCLSNVSSLEKNVVRLVALPLKYEDTFSAEARVIAIEE